ncbi:HIT family protein [Nesterenkonia flava]|uniref:HIT domain-containing protein n=1 Tax=Nesterenkonia flava TaxID=469799 RepID=A0ABU1FVZ0_9MICC|nr:HIT domain-containing protein [Nesterenkonia flava]MDR5712844.1 HIT domain-containing protein [Nesterenkonia flava]
MSGEEQARIDDFRLAGVPDAFQRLWNPHRAAYQSRGQDQVTGADDCPFCQGPARSDEDSLIVARGKTCFVILNLYPYNPGHVLVCPYRHVPDLTDLRPEEAAEFTRLAQQAMRVLRAVAKPAGFNLGINQGKVGGAGIAAHLHQHVIPRWGGDTNFLPVIAQTKNLSATLGETRQLLAEAWGAHTEDAAGYLTDDDGRVQEDH